MLWLWKSGSTHLLWEAAPREEVVASQREHRLHHQSAHAGGSSPSLGSSVMRGVQSTEQVFSKQSWGRWEMRDERKQCQGGGRCSGLIRWWLWQTACLWDLKIWTRRPVNGLAEPHLLELTWKSIVLGRFLQKIGKPFSFKTNKREINMHLSLNKIIFISPLKKLWWVLYMALTLVLVSATGKVVWKCQMNSFCYCLSLLGSSYCILV